MHNKVNYLRSSWPSPGGALGARAPPSQKKQKKSTLRILDFNVNITIFFSLCTSDGYHFTIDKQLI
jgi:hypothetical protein